jgi:hypothetical protein
MAAAALPAGLLLPFTGRAEKALAAEIGPSETHGITATRR